VLVAGFSAFLALRGAECLRQIVRERLPVTVLALLPGLSADRDGAAHQSVGEVAMLAAFGWRNALWPADSAAAAAAAEAVTGTDEPSWVALGREETPAFEPWAAEQRDRRWRTLRRGPGPTIIAWGHVLNVVAPMPAAQRCSLIEVLDPLFPSAESLQSMLLSAGSAVLVAEEQSEPGPLASRCRAAAPPGTSVTAVGIDPLALQSGSRTEILRVAGIGTDRIEQSLLRIGA
jgi:transketolase C-terminal domain/subunit